MNNFIAYIFGHAISPQTAEIGFSEASNFSGSHLVLILAILFIIGEMVFYIKRRDDIYQD